jgi:hypothetical protein
MINLFAFVDPSLPSATDSINVAINIMSEANSIGAKIYPLIASFGLIRALLHHV